MIFQKQVVNQQAMQWFLLAMWSVVVFLYSQSRWLRPLLVFGLVSAMGTQLLLLKADGLFTWENALPLHLCSLFGVLSVPLLWRSCSLYEEAVCFLGAPAAFLTLFFPAVIRCSHPTLMQTAFYQLHVLLSLIPLFFYRTGKPLPTDPRRTLVMGSGYLLFICLFNRLSGTNYLFLRAAPAGTPLEWLFRHGPTLYLCALVMLCMLVFALLRPVYAYFRK